MSKKPKIKVCVIGGGTGTFTVLKGIKKYDALDISCIVSVMDSGGSNRILRDEFGILPTSDIRQCLIALADESQNELLRNLFTYRYNHGTGISGMTFGNLFMAALTDMYKSQKAAIEKTCEFFKIKGRIIPITYDDVHLIAKYQNGKEVLGEHLIDEPKEDFGEIVKLSTIPKARISKEAMNEIKNAQYLILGPGDLFTSIIADLVVQGTKNAISKSKSKIIYISNLMTKFGQTTNYGVKRHIEVLEEYLGRKIDYCLVNNHFNLPHEISDNYLKEKSNVVSNDLPSSYHAKVISGNYLSSSIYVKNSSDSLKRSLLRHDSSKLAKEIMKIVKSV